MSGRRARLGLPLTATASAVALAVTLAGCTPSTGGSLKEPEPSASKRPGARSGEEVTDADFTKIRGLLDRRGTALEAGDRRAFLATLDPGNKRLRTQQLAYFDNLQSLPVDEVYFGMDEVGLSATRVRGDDPTVRPAVHEHVSMDGVTYDPMSNQISVTFVKRKGRWLVGAEVLDETFEAQERPWFGGRIEASRDGGLLAVTDAGADVGSDEVLATVQADLAAVVDVLERGARERLLIDATTNGSAHELSNASGEDAGAVSFEVASLDLLGEDYVGPAASVIKLNPDLIDQLVDDTWTMRHELTHFVLSGYGASVPFWASEGIAECVGASPLTLAELATYDETSELIGARLTKRIRERPVELTPAGDWGNDPELDYLAAQATSEYLITTYGLPKFFAMWDNFRKRQRGRGVYYGEGIVDDVLRDTYGVGEQAVARGADALLNDLTE